MRENNSRVITKAEDMRHRNVNFLAATNYTVYMFNETPSLPLHELSTYLYLNLNHIFKS